VRVAALRGAHVVDGALTIATSGAVELTALEVVHGELGVRGAMTSLELPALRQVAARWSWMRRRSSR